MNKSVIRDFKCVNNLLEVLNHYCSCSKSLIKRVISKIPDIKSCSLVSYSGCCVNTLAAVVGRHAWSRLTYNPRVLKQFAKFVYSPDTTYSKLRDYLMFNDHTITFETYLEHVASYDVKKALQYRKAAEAYCAKYELPSYKVFAKPGEWFEKWDGVDVKGMSNRSRLIHNPPEFVKAFGGYFNHIMMNGLKCVTDSYIGGLSP
jgi:hypothetical protein